MRGTMSTVSGWLGKALTIGGAGPALAVMCGTALAGDLSRDGLTAVRTYCSGCHHETAPQHFERISEIRESPEGWAMTMFRMHQAHGLTVPSEARDTILQYLSSVNGLAPSESAAGRFALERRPNAQDLQLGEELRVMCGRCHSMARTALQRRNADEWLKLVHMHVGQWPTLEYQESGRNRYWWQIATTEVPGKLAAQFPRDTKAWTAWKSHPHPSLAGQWIVYGHTPGRGDYHGTATVTPRGSEQYTATYKLTYNDGARLDGSSTAVVYTGYEWRGTATLGSETVREVFAASEDGTKLTGRWFAPEHAEHGGEWVAVKGTGAPALLSVSPRALRSGTTQQVVLVGRGLQGEVSFGPGTHCKVVDHEPGALTVSVTVDAGAEPGLRTIQVGRTSAPALAAVYQHVERLQVEPAFGIARLGGGKLDAVDAQFEAQGYIDVVNAAGKKTPVALGPMPVSWSVEPFDAQAEKAGDVRFAGRIDATGRFLPAGAGPNPQRQFSGNNVGNLFVVAALSESGGEVRGKGHLIVTVQRWNTPPIY
jgi:quinohemoprotein amine dehydrogenase